MTRRAKIALASCGIALSLAVSGVSAWAAVEYAAGRDPFAALAPALVTTGDAAAATDAGGAEGGNAGGSAPAALPGGRDADDAGANHDVDQRGAANANDGAASAMDDLALGSSPAGDSGQADADGAAVGPSTDGVAPGDEAAHVAASDAPVADDAVITVTVSVDAAPAGGNASTRVVSVPVGATAYDALVATGANVNARATAFGTYVAAINGLAEKEHGGMSGWVYAVGGVEPNVAASACVLSDGDVVTWTYVNVEY